MRCRSIKPYTVVKQLVTVLIGVIIGLLAVGLTLATEAVTTWKNHRVRAVIHADTFAQTPTLGFALGVLFHMAFSGTLALAGAGVVCTHPSSASVSPTLPHLPATFDPCD